MVPSNTGGPRINSLFEKRGRLFTTKDLQQYENEINNPTVKNGWMQARGVWSYMRKEQKNERQRLGMISLVPAVEH